MGWKGKGKKKIFYIYIYIYFKSRNCIEFLYYICTNTYMQPKERNKRICLTWTNRDSKARGTLYDRMAIWSSHSFSTLDEFLDVSKFQ